MLKLFKTKQVFVLISGNRIEMTRLDTMVAASRVTSVALDLYAGEIKIFQIMDGILKELRQELFQTFKDRQGRIETVIQHTEGSIIPLGDKGVEALTDLCICFGSFKTKVIESGKPLRPQDVINEFPL